MGVWMWLHKNTKPGEQNWIPHSAPPEHLDRPFHSLPQVPHLSEMTILPGRFSLTVPGLWPLPSGTLETGRVQHGPQSFPLIPQLASAHCCNPVHSPYTSSLVAFSVVPAELLALQV